MKKISAIIILVISVLLTIQSCKSREHCPAYGENTASYYENKA
jgi:hypothetical protein